MKKSVSSAMERAHMENLSNSVAKGASSIWNRVVSGASQMLGMPTPLSDKAVEVLSALSDDADSPFDDSDSHHLKILADLWAILLGPQSTFQRTSANWKSLGFQKEDPTFDLKNSGVLALLCMGYLGHRYKRETQTIISKNSNNVNTNYPFAIVGVNLCMLLIEQLNLRSSKFLGIQAGYWGIFEDKNAFYEIFCVMFFHLDNQWTMRGEIIPLITLLHSLPFLPLSLTVHISISCFKHASFCVISLVTALVRSKFGELIKEMKSLLSRIFERSPNSIDKFKEVAFDEGMLLGQP